jgi:aldehyde oxidoreductase
MNSNATKKAADLLLDAMKKPDGTYRTYDEMVSENLPTKYEAQYSNTVIEGLCPTDPNTGLGDHIPGYSHMLFLAEVAVDTKTGKTTVLRFTCVDDVGVVGNIDALNGRATAALPTESALP